MQRMMPGGVSSFPGCLPQHRKCQYSGNMINVGNVGSFPKKRCDYTQYNQLLSAKSEGELTCCHGSVTLMMSPLKQHASSSSSVLCVHVNIREHPPFLSSSRYSQPFDWSILWAQLPAWVDPLRLRGQCAVAGQPASPPGLWPAESPGPDHLKAPHRNPAMNPDFFTVRLPELLTFVALSLLGVALSALAPCSSPDITMCLNEFWYQG